MEAAEGLDARELIRKRERRASLSIVLTAIDTIIGT